VVRGTLRRIRDIGLRRRLRGCRLFERTSGGKKGWRVVEEQEGGERAGAVYLGGIGAAHPVADIALAVQQVVDGHEAEAGDV
jgi:hypothetical protein